jgi:hypothetical protein
MNEEELLAIETRLEAEPYNPIAQRLFAEVRRLRGIIGWEALKDPTQQHEPEIHT